MKKHVKRYLSLALTFALVFAIPFAFTQEASAASKKSSKKVTVYLVKESSEVRTEDGKSSSTFTKYTYNKKGFMTKQSWSGTDGKGKSVYKRNGKGVTTSIKTYKGKKLIAITKNTIKKGKIVTSKYYEVKKGKKKLISQDKYIYKGKTLIRIDWKDFITKEKGSVNMTDNGQATNATEKLDDHGNVIERIETRQYPEDGVTVTETWKVTHKYSYDSAGNILRDEETSTTTYSGGETSNTYTSTSVSTYKYKKMKIAKKYLTLG